MFAMNIKPKERCCGVVFICTIAFITLNSGFCEPVEFSTGPPEQRLSHDTRSLLTTASLKTKRQHLGSRLRPWNPNIHPKFIKSAEHLGETSGMSSFGRYQNNPINSFKTSCNKGEVEHIVLGRFDFAGAGQASPHYYSSGLTHSGAEVRSDLQPVVVCAEASMTLTVRRRWAAQLRVVTGNDFPFSLSMLPSHCGYSIQKNWRDISIGVPYNGCHVTQENFGGKAQGYGFFSVHLKANVNGSIERIVQHQNLSHHHRHVPSPFTFMQTLTQDVYSMGHWDWTGGRYVLPLLWQRTPVKISCPVSPMNSQAVNRPSLCCSQSGIAIRIQGPSSAKELNVNVRGEWTPLLELVQHCGFSLMRGNAEILITAPFLSCGIIVRDGNRELFLQIGQDVFLLTCRVSTTEVRQHQSPQPTTVTKPMTPKPFQWVPSFYLAQPHYPHPSRRYRTHVHSSSPLTPIITTTATQQRETPQQDEQNSHIRPHERYYRKRPPLKDLAPYPTQAPRLSPPLLPHNNVFNRYYHYYHDPKILLTNWPPNRGSVVKLQQPDENRDKMAMFYLNFADLYSKLHRANLPMPHNSIFQHDLTKNDLGGFWNPTLNAHTSPLPTFTPNFLKAHTVETNEKMKIWPDVNDYRDFATVNPSVKTLYRPTIQHPPNGNTPHHHLPPHLHQFYQLYHLYQASQGRNTPSPFTRPQQAPNPVPPSENPPMQYGFGSYFQPERPVQFEPGNHPAEGLNNEAGSKAHPDPSFDGSSWEKWFNIAAKVNSVPQQLYMFPPLFPVKEEDANVQDCIMGENFVFSLPEFVVEPKVVGPGPSEGSCAVKRLTSNPNLFFVPLQGCGVTKQIIDALMIYQLELETCDSDNSLKRMLVECSSYPGLPAAQRLFFLDPLPQLYPVPLQLRIATDESPHSYHPEAHLPLSSVLGRLVLLELSLPQRPDPGVALQALYCLAYTVTPSSAMLIYDSRLPESESQLLPSPSSNTQYIVVTNFLSITSPSPSIVNDVDPEVYFFCLTEVCSASDGVCATTCINSSGQK